MKSASAKIEKPSPGNPKSSVQSLAKAFRVLEAIAGSEADMTLSEIADVADLDPGTTHRMLNTMVELGYVARADGKRFTLTLKVLDLGFRAIGHRDIRTLARPVVDDAVDFVGAGHLPIIVGSARAPGGLADLTSCPDAAASGARSAVV